MTDLNEMRALKASFQGALDTAAALEALKGKVMSLDPNGDVSAEDLEELGRVTLAHGFLEISVSSSSGQFPVGLLDKLET